MNEYALYKGDELLAMGTVREIAKQLGIREKTIRFYGSPSQEKRSSNKARRLIKIED